MTLENFKWAEEIVRECAKLKEEIECVERVRTSENDSFRFGDGNSSFWVSHADPMAREGCKAILLANLNGKVKQLETELEKL